MIRLRIPSFLPNVAVIPSAPAHHITVIPNPPAHDIAVIPNSPAHAVTVIPNSPAQAVTVIPNSPAQAVTVIPNRVEDSVRNLLLYFAIPLLSLPKQSNLLSSTPPDSLPPRLPLRPHPFLRHNKKGAA
jgi:hypothetical protein